MRNRSDGWKHAKISGHLNEDKVYDQLCNNGDLYNWLCKEINCEYLTIQDYGGISEKNIPSILKDKTKSKTDIYLKNKNDLVNISLKKSTGGQVFLISPERFILGFSNLFKPIPDNVIKAINLFFGSSNEVLIIIESMKKNNNFEPKIINYMIRKNRLVGEALKLYDEDLYNNLLEWFKVNINEVFLFCFSRGLASEPSNYATHVLYCNMLGETNEKHIFDLNMFKEPIENNKSLISYGERNGGTTINLPFGFVQWHKGCLQFHHSLTKLKNLVN